MEQNNVIDTKKIFNPAALDDIASSRKLEMMLNSFEAEFEKTDVLMASVEAAADMAADCNGIKNAPPMVLKAWRLAQLMQEQRFRLNEAFERFKEELMENMLYLKSYELRDEAEEAKKNIWENAAREKRNAARRAARAAKKAAASKPAPSGKSKPKAGQKQAK